jgi:topoisomerase-4 subunit A
MRLLKLDPGQGFKKCARVVGDVIGKYHPHGDQAVYDALVRLAQDFAQRYPLIDGQGNFGNVDGDNAAAMRYTEARMTDTAKRLLDGLDEDAVDWRETYDGEDKEPIVLPGGFPNLLGNGSSGIAVGMATSIPPHNAFELCNACQHLIKNPDAEVDELLEHIKGPDFPTGGLLVPDQGSIREAYATGVAASGCGHAGKWKNLAGTMGNCCHRDPLSGSKVTVDREDRRASDRPQAPASGRCARRVRGRHSRSFWCRAPRTSTPTS